MVYKYEAALTALAFGVKPSILLEKFSGSTLTKAYYISNSDFMNDDIQEIYREEYKKRFTENSEQMRERINKRHKEYNKEMRKNAIEILGNKCVSCGISDYRVLEINHKNPLKMWRGRSKIREDVDTICRDIVLQKRDLSNIEILCANCHRIKTYYGNKIQEVNE